MAQDLPTPVEMFRSSTGPLSDAYGALGDAADWLRSDWPSGFELTDDQADAKREMYRQIEAAKNAINKAKDAAERAAADPESAIVARYSRQAFTVAIGPKNAPRSALDWHTAGTLDDADKVLAGLGMRRVTDWSDPAAGWALVEPIGY